MHRWRCDKGQLLVIIAVAIPAILALLALVVDVGLLAVTKARLQASADAAALAAGMELPNGPTHARMQADNYINLNSNRAESTIEIDENNSSITVHLQQDVSLLFASILGFDTATPRVRAKASILPLAGARGIRPMGIVAQPFVYGELYTLREGPGDSVAPRGGNFGSLRLSGNGADKYRQDLAQGYAGVIHIGDIIQTQPGLMGMNTRKGLADVLAGCNENWPSISRSCSRLLTMPVIDSFPPGGTGPVTVVGLAVFFLESVEGPPDFNVTGRFLEWVAANGEHSDANTPNYGAYTLRLQR